MADGAIVDSGNATVRLVAADDIVQVPPARKET
jgi:hypothetical protein